MTLGPMQLTWQLVLSWFVMSATVAGGWTFGRFVVTALLSRLPNGKGTT